MKVFATVVRRVKIVQGGDLPPGAAVMSDGLSLVATVFLADANASLSESALYAITLSLVDENGVPGEDLTVALNGAALADAVSAQNEAVVFALSGLDEAVPGQAETLLLAVRGDQLADALAEQLEAATIGVSGSGLADSNPAPADTSGSTVLVWGNATTTAGTAPTNPENAIGPNDGAVAQVKTGGLTAGSSTLNITLPAASIPASGSKLIQAWYATTAGVADSFSLQFEGGGTVGTLALPAGNFLASPYELALSGTLQAAPAFVFTHAATVPATGGNVQIDAVAVVTTGVF